MSRQKCGRSTMSSHQCCRLSVILWLIAIPTHPMCLVSCLTAQIRRMRQVRCLCHLAHECSRSGVSGRHRSVVIRSSNQTMNTIASNICKNFAGKGFANRGVKYSSGYHDLNASNMPAMMVRTYFAPEQMMWPGTGA